VIGEDGKARPGQHDEDEGKQGYVNVYLGQEPKANNSDGGFFEGGGDDGDYESGGHHGGTIIAGWRGFFIKVLTKRKNDITLATIGTKHNRMSTDLL
jgi:hypothetical protein